MTRFTNGGFIGRNTITSPKVLTNGKWTLSEHNIYKQQGSWVQNTLINGGLSLNLNAALASSYGGQNQLQYSDDFSNTTGWNTSTYLCTVYPNSALAPDGTMTADLVLGGSPNPILFYANTLTNIPTNFSTGAKRVSVYAKKATSTYFTFNCYWDGDTETNIDFDLVNGTCSNAASATIEYVGDGWYLCSYTVPARVNTGTSMSWRIWPAGRGGSNGGIYVWGAQQREATTVSGYVKTTSAYVNLNSTTWNDLSTNAYNATLVNTPTFSTTNGRGLIFNGTSQYATIPYATSPFRQQYAITYDAWVYMDATQTGGNFAGTSVASGNGSGGINIGKTSSSFVWTPTGASDTTISTSAYTSIESKWSNLTFAIDYGSKSYAWYLNGQLISSSINASPTNYTPATSYNQNINDGIGGRYVNSQQYFSGKVGSLRVYNRALSAEEVLTNYYAHQAII